MQDRFERFTERARMVLTLVQEEALRLNHNYIDTEHLLLGLVREGHGVAARVLNNLGLDLEKARSAVETRIGTGLNPPQGAFGMTPRAKRVIDLAVEETRSLNHFYTGTEHLLLGLIRENEGIGIGVLRDLGVDPENVRNRVLQIIAQSNPQKEIKDPTIEKPAPPQPEKINQSQRFEVFTEGAKLVLTRAQEEAQRYNHNFIGTEHILLGLIRDENSLAARILTDMGVPLSKVRSAVGFIIGRGDRAVMGEIGLTPRAKTVIELAVDEARRLNHHYIGTEHILLGLIAEGEGIAAGVLSSLNVELRLTRQRVKHAMEEEGK